MVPRADLGTRGENLRDLIAVSKIHDLFRNVIALENTSFDVKVTGEVQMPFDGVLTLP